MGSASGVLLTLLYNCMSKLYARNDQINEVQIRTYISPKFFLPFSQTEDVDLDEFSVIRDMEAQ